MLIHLNEQGVSILIFLVILARYQDYSQAIRKILLTKFQKLKEEELWDYLMFAEFHKELQCSNNKDLIDSHLILEYH